MTNEYENYSDDENSEGSQSSDIERNKKPTSKRVQKKPSRIENTPEETTPKKKLPQK